MFQRHPTLQPRMRAILLDWLIEVCEVYKLHRETYYLAMDYIDRYLSTHQNVPKNQLQLIGITCLFIASKVREIFALVLVMRRIIIFFSSLSMNKLEYYGFFLGFFFLQFAYAHSVE